MRRGSGRSRRQEAAIASSCKMRWQSSDYVYALPALFFAAHRFLFYLKLAVPRFLLRARERCTSFGYSTPRNVLVILYVIDLSSLTYKRKSPHQRVSPSKHPRGFGAPHHFLHTPAKSTLSALVQCVCLSQCTLVSFAAIVTGLEAEKTKGEITVQSYSPALFNQLFRRSPKDAYGVITKL